MSQWVRWDVGAVLLAVGLGTACQGGHPAGEPTPTSPTETGGADPQDKKTDFATGNGQPAAIPFDSERAMKYLKQLCDIGPRVSGSVGMKKQQALVEKHFKDLGATVTRQEFKARQRSKREDVAMTNLIVTWHPDRTRRVLLCAHYDTRPLADQEANRANWTRPFLSANDGTGGLALLMELGHHMKNVKSEFGIDFVLFDGEEYVFDTGPNGADKYFFGSEHFAEEYSRTRNTRKYRYDAGVLMDLCTAKGAQLKVEAHSYRYAPQLVDQVWGVAKALGAKSFVYKEGYSVLDDHIALNEAGIPTIDVIDFDYPHWHKLSDTPDKISGEQMAEVAKVLTTWVQRIK